ncbi:phosphoribosyltransferase [Pseudidiomarina andamanensis]|uniref:Phosphoribosyltransferase n=1 Tax=Pseudidiomarina andamanensis TaxID=1940690 RepID=A0AA92IMZ9_9GAMM|nr:phosphoribosyltransferase [Pseudidiomarina andamanensis]MDS0219007.1 phosphoribosyltransferase [Pseudidiomarina andamanensis]QGT96362.1 phosphoribosyltransferase [Pseudidiomarina andamanensis]
MKLPFKNRREAGEQLASELTSMIGLTNVLVLALPRGGVPVAEPIAQCLGAPLSVLLVRKLGVPGQPEVAMGAISENGVRVLNKDIVDTFAIDAREIARIEQRERQELERRQQLYRSGNPLPEVTGKTVILVDDGLATGATMKAAVEVLKREKVGTIVVAVPVAARETALEIRSAIDQLICLAQPHPLEAIGYWYLDFAQVNDEEVLDIMLRHSSKFGSVT